MKLTDPKDMNLIDITGWEFPAQETDSIETIYDLARFVEKLREDLLSNPDDWENPTLESFLDGLSAQIEGHEQLYKNFRRETPIAPSWRVFAEFMAGAKIHE